MASAKYDGDRILAYKEDNRIRLLSRSGEDRTDRFPGIAQAILSLEPASLVPDGEVVVFDKRGVEARLSDQFDAVIHFDQTRAVEPLEPIGKQSLGEPAETFPSGI